MYLRKKKFITMCTRKIGPAPCTLEKMWRNSAGGRYYIRFYSDNNSNSQNSSENSSSPRSGSASPENGPIDPNSPDQDRSKYIVSTLGSDRDAIENYFDNKRAAIRYAYSDNSEQCQNLLDELNSQETDVKDLAGLSIGALSTGYSPLNLSDADSDSNPNSQPRSPIIQDSSDVIGGDEPMEFGDE